MKHQWGWLKTSLLFAVTHAAMYERTTVYQSCCAIHTGSVALAKDTNMTIMSWTNETFPVDELNDTLVCHGGSDPDTFAVCGPDQFLGQVDEIHSSSLWIDEEDDMDMHNMSMYSNYTRWMNMTGSTDTPMSTHPMSTENGTEMIDLSECMCRYEVSYQVADKEKLTEPMENDTECLQREVRPCCSFEDDGDLQMDLSMDNGTGEVDGVQWWCDGTQNDVCAPPEDATNYTILEQRRFRSWWLNDMDGTVEASCECFWEFIDCNFVESTHDPDGPPRHTDDDSHGPRPDTTEDDRFKNTDDRHTTMMVTDPTDDMRTTMKPTKDGMMTTRDDRQGTTEQGGDDDAGANGLMKMSLSQIVIHLVFVLSVSVMVIV